MATRKDLLMLGRGDHFHMKDQTLGDKLDFSIESLGECKYDNPIPSASRYVRDCDKLSYFHMQNDMAEFQETHGYLPAFEVAGPREKIFFEPDKVVAGIVTCGGLCPGLNDVIRALTYTLNHYGVQRVYGLPYGYEGLTFKHSHHLKVLNAYSCANIHNWGGTILHTSRGPQDPIEMVEYLVQKGINMLFTIGGDGTQHGAAAICDEIKKRGLEIAVVGIPKTIDNDLLFIEKTFGFETAVDEAKQAVNCIHNESTAAWNGIGLVKLMGRDSGFIAAHTALASSDINICLVPEMDFNLDGPNGLLNSIERRLNQKHHCVIAVAEGAGQKFFTETGETDKSGNKKYGDIGLFLKEKINGYFRDHPLRPTLKYVDPSYMIRSLPAGANDGAFCLSLGQSAAHAAMAGKTNMIAGYWSRFYTHVPIKYTTSGRKKIKMDSLFWDSVLQVTRQPIDMT
jgi:6-phosphofructokinase 1